MTDPAAVLSLVLALAFIFACGFVSGQLSMKYRKHR